MVWCKVDRPCILRFQELLQPLASSAAKLYPGWRMRVYHNVTQGDKPAWTKLCQVYCHNEHVDLCDVHDLPAVGDLGVKFPVGR